jgi:adenylate cyclase
MGAGALRQLGEDAEAREFARQALSAGSDDPAVYYNLGCFYAIGGEADKAFDCLEKSIELGFAHREWLEHDSDLKSLQQHPRYRALLERIRGR